MEAYLGEASVSRLLFPSHWSEAKRCQQTWLWNARIHPSGGELQSEVPGGGRRRMMKFHRCGGRSVRMRTLGRHVTMCLVPVFFLLPEDFSVMQERYL